MSQPDFGPVFAALRDMMLRHADGLSITRDEPGDLVVRIPSESGEPGWFGTATIKKSYVAYHLMPIYYDPALAEDLSPELTRRRQGKTCFNFKKIEPALFDELEALTAKVRAAT